jgi:hypothetical protein
MLIFEKPAGMSKKFPSGVTPEDQKPVSELPPEVAQAALILMALFGWLTFLILLLAGSLFYSSFLVSSPTIRPALWSFAGLGTVCAICTVSLRHWIKISR